MSELRDVIGFGTMFDVERFQKPMFLDLFLIFDDEDSGIKAASYR